MSKLPNVIRFIVVVSAAALAAHAAEPSKSQPTATAAKNNQAQIDALLKQQQDAQRQFESNLSQHRNTLQAANAHGSAGHATAHSYSAQSVNASGKISLGALKNIANAVSQQARSFKSVCDNVARSLDMFGAHAQATACRNAGNNAVNLSNQLSRIVSSARVGQRIQFSIPNLATLDAVVTA